MFSKPIKVALLMLIAASLSLIYAGTAAFAQNPIPKHPKADQLDVVTGIVYSQPHNLSGGLFPSSWQEPNGNDADQYVWDNFTLQSTQVITEVQWRGGYDPLKGGSGGPVLDFTVAIYASIAGGSQPDVVNPPLIHYLAGGNAGETLAGTFSGTTMYDYAFTLPAPFTASAGTTYWVQIEAWQGGIPDWGIAVGTGGSDPLQHHFRRTTNGSDIFYLFVPGDVAFTLLGPNVPIANLNATNSSPTTLSQTTTFTATVSAGNSIRYNWDFGDSVLGVGQILTHTYGSVGFYTAIVTASNDLNTVTATTRVTITDAPLVGLTASNDSPTLLGNSTRLTATIASGSNVTYHWDFGDEVLGQGKLVTHTCGTVGFYTAIVTASNSLNTVTATTHVTITDVPISGLSAINDSPTELGHVTVFSATKALGSGEAYQWNFGDGVVRPGRFVTHTYSAIGFFTAIVTASNPVSVITATTPVTIFSAMPLANAGPDQKVTAGTQVTLDGSGSFAPAGHEPLTYFWQQIGGMPVVLNSATISRPTFLAPAAASVLTFTLVVTDSFNLASGPDQVQIDVVPQYHLHLPLVLKNN